MFAPAASADTLLKSPASGSSPFLRACHAAPLAEGAAVKRFTSTARETGLLLARLDAKSRRGDWDVAVFGAGGRFVAAAAGPTSDEVASGFVAAGEELTVHACLVRGDRSSAAVRVDTVALPQRSGPAEKVQILAVDTPTRADRNRLMALGFDDSHSHTSRTLDIVVRGAADIQKLRDNGFTWKVEAADLLAREGERVQLDRAYAARTRRSALPSGPTEYRHLADYEAEMKALAEKTRASSSSSRCRRRASRGARSSASRSARTSTSRAASPSSSSSGSTTRASGPPPSTSWSGGTSWSAATARTTRSPRSSTRRAASWSRSSIPTASICPVRRRSTRATRWRWSTSPRRSTSSYRCRTRPTPPC